MLYEFSMFGNLYEKTKSAQIPFIIVGVCALFVFSVIVTPVRVHAEYIDSFVSDINIQKDSTFDVSEKINYVFTEYKHGIYRCIPNIHQDRASSLLKERYIDIAVDSVSMDNESVPYTIEKKRTEICVKVGDSSKTVMGQHVYEIRYTVAGAVSYQTFGGAELYWNATGNEWATGMHSVEVNVSSEEQLLVRERACYRGVTGKTDSCANSVDENGIVHFSGTNFAPYEGLTIAQALDRSKVSMDIRERYKPVLMWGVFMLLVFVGGAVALYRYKTKFKTDAPIIAQYEPYEGMKPMYVGYLFDKRLDARDITAGIVYLAQQGFIKIRKTEKKVLFLFEVDDYEIEHLRAADDKNDAFEKGVLELVFGNITEIGKKVMLQDLKNDYVQGRKNVVRLQSLRNALLNDVIQNDFFAGMLFITRRTRKGYEALDHLKGFKDFLSVTESQRYIFHNAPAINAEHFMEYLPYAIAFGVEKQWAKVFEGITIQNPNWYDGGSVGTFNAVGLTQSLGAFATAFTSSFSTRSASSGGGHSGGGSGGGGGGSW